MTEDMRDILEFLAPVEGEGLTLAYDIAASCGLSPRGIGQRLRALETRGFVRRAVVKKSTSMGTDNLYGWEITTKGWESLL